MKKHLLTILFIIFSNQILAMKRPADDIFVGPDKKKYLDITDLISSKDFCALIEQGERDRLQEILESNPNWLSVLNFPANTDIIAFAFEKGQDNIAYTLLLYSNNKNTDKAREICKNKYPLKLKAFREYLISLSNSEIFKNKIFNEKFVDLSEQRITSENIEALALALRDNKEIVALDLYGNEILESEAQILIGALKTMPSLKLLNLSGENDEGLEMWNEIGDMGAIALAELLEAHKGLTMIKIDHNDIGAESMRKLIEALTYNTTVIRLDITGNDTLFGALNIFLEEKLERNRVLHRTLPNISTMMLSFKEKGILPEIGNIIAYKYFTLMQTEDGTFDRDNNRYSSWTEELENSMNPKVAPIYYVDPTNWMTVTFNPPDKIPHHVPNPHIFIYNNGFFQIFDLITMQWVYPIFAQIWLDPYTGAGMFYPAWLNQEAAISFQVFHPMPHLQYE
jgi:hypothetical protein